MRATSLLLLISLVPACNSGSDGPAPPEISLSTARNFVGVLIDEDEQEYTAYLRLEALRPESPSTCEAAIAFWLPPESLVEKLGGEVADLGLGVRGIVTIDGDRMRFQSLALETAWVLSEVGSLYPDPMFTPIDDRYVVTHFWQP